VTLANAIRRFLPARYRPIGYLTHLVQRRTHCRVRQGCFAGMRYAHDSVGSAYLPKLLGMYERELAPCVEAICSHTPALIVDVGAAEGYYAVGLALRNPQAKVIAFEMEPRGQAALRGMAALNNAADRVDVRGRCEPDDLAQALAGAHRPVVVCDVEGYEDALLDPARVPQLRGAAVLVEVHDFIVPGIADELRRRFDPTHAIETIWQQPRDRKEFPWRTPATMLLPTSYLDWAVSEWRPVQMSWLWMQPTEPPPEPTYSPRKAHANSSKKTRAVFGRALC
jgi:hypothetical protein